MPSLITGGWSKDYVLRVVGDGTAGPDAGDEEDDGGWLDGKTLWPALLTHNGEEWARCELLLTPATIPTSTSWASSANLMQTVDLQVEQGTAVTYPDDNKVEEEGDGKLRKAEASDAEVRAEKRLSAI